MGVAAPHPTGGVGRFTVASVVPMFNGAETVERCLRSILEQERPADEIVVVDDGSTDESAAVVERIDDSHITLIRQPNRGVAAARNAGTRAASSDFVTFLDCDDYAKVGWLAALMAAAEENDALVVAASYEQVGDTSADQCDPSPREPSSRAPYLAGSYLVSRAVFEEVGGFDERLRYSENHEFFMRIQSYCDEHGAEVIRLNQKLVVVDRSHSGASARWRLDAVRLILSKHGEEIRSDPRRHSRWLGIGAVESVRHGQPTAALRYALAAVRSTPQSSRCWLRLLACLCYPVARARWGSYEEAPA